MPKKPEKQAPETTAQKRARARRIYEALTALYPDVKCTLDHQTPHQLLVATILAAQCTDEKVNQVTPALFERYPDVRAFAEADIVELESIIRPTGFFHQKAKAIIASAQDILSRFDGQVPETIDELITLQGVGRKTANVIIGVAFGKPAVIVDTHVKRIANRLGLTANTDPDRIETDLREILDESFYTIFNHLIVAHGRTVCKAQKPQCPDCGLLELCPFGKKELGIKS